MIADGELTVKQRNTLLAQMTDQVAALVLRDNYFQTQSLSVAGRVAPELLDAQQRFIQFLEKAGRLNRALEFLPADEEIAERRAKKLGLAAPERAVLLAYSKMWLSDELLASNLPEDAWIGTALGRYFPQTLREVYAGVMPRHPLRREIIATHVVNSMVNRVGSTFVHRLMETTGARSHEIVRAYLLHARNLRLRGAVAGDRGARQQGGRPVQAEMLIEAGRLTVRATSWFLRSRRLDEPMEQMIETFRPGVESLYAHLPRLLDAQARSQIESRPRGGCRRECRPRSRTASPRSIRCSRRSTSWRSRRIRSVRWRPWPAVYFELASKLGLAWLRERIGQIAGDSHWHTLAKSAMRDDLAGLQRTLAVNVLAGWRRRRSGRARRRMGRRKRDALERASRLLAELRAAPAPDLAMLSVALRELRNLA